VALDSYLLSLGVQVSSRDLHPNAVAAARKMAGDKAQPALELVGYDQELSAAIKYTFGGAFVCKVRWLLAAARVWARHAI
jgi:hypothetical protein